jgi:hypothetical protein
MENSASLELPSLDILQPKSKESYYEQDHSIASSSFKTNQQTKTSWLSPSYMKETKSIFVFLLLVCSFLLHPSPSQPNSPDYSREQEKRRGSSPIAACLLLSVRWRRVPRRVGPVDERALPVPVLSHRRRRLALLRVVR